MDTEKLSTAYLHHLASYAVALSAELRPIAAAPGEHWDRDDQAKAVDCLWQLKSILTQISVAFDICHQGRKRPKQHVKNNVRNMLGGIEDDFLKLRNVFRVLRGRTVLVAY